MKILAGSSPAGVKYTLPPQHIFHAPRNECYFLLTNIGFYGIIIKGGKT